ncbi:methyltransferase domain-containing protein [Ancylobacter radicis]|uniref:Methyltransferase domain-containing protein n=1 Tax=Ancylobacter radicis TaxID=2836179 RepID=A0ABS5R680_9HYPH|nr:TylF/MycF/NovP-related O-methyltransferase [Ancylobacter radicis]MBS9476702.1 methyltransferase domain-containing protein [Ancylobacter radicis]
MLISCSVCGGSDVTKADVLWPELVAAWELSPHEVGYVNHQQGTKCRDCGTQIRGMALARAILAWMGETAPLRSVLAGERWRDLRVADMNGCAGVSESFAGLPGYQRADFPDFDMQNLSIADGTFDLVFHSDTLEHIPDPAAALRECLRVLKPGGRMCFTAPVIVGRLTRRRDGLPPSYHGSPDTQPEDYIVHSEFGADIWTLLAEAGATSIQLEVVDYPSGLAWSVARPGDAPIFQVIAEPVPCPIEEAPPMSAPPISDEPAEVSPLDLYDQDALTTRHNHEFMNDPAFRRAYARGVKAAETDYRWHWRVHVGLWAAHTASKLPGDFVECGVNKGFLSSAIMELLDWDRTGRTFYLLDTFNGIDPRYISDEERAEGILDKNKKTIESGFYLTSAEAAIANFAEWKNHKIIVGAVPETLDQIKARQIAFLSIDMNCMPPEVAALEYLWDRLSDGAVVLLDDYAYVGYRQQKLGMDACVKKFGVGVLSLPTGQGLIIKPPRRPSAGSGPLAALKRLLRA